MRLVDTAISFVIGATVGYWFSKPPRRRMRKRYKDFLVQRSGTTTGISSDLVASAYYLLQSALNDRGPNNWTEQNNHSSRFAPAVIVTIFTAFDAWLNEIIGAARSQGKLTDHRVGELLEMQVPDKYRAIAKDIFCSGASAPTDLRLLNALRNEIIHFLPYIQNVAEETVPQKLLELEKKGLFIDSGDPKVDFLFTPEAGLVRACVLGVRRSFGSRLATQGFESSKPDERRGLRQEFLDAFAASFAIESADVRS
jgi:hypothetical protein